MPQVPVPPSMTGWCEAMFDYGLIGNNVTGLHYGLQCHITVTKPTSNDGVGFHISVYNTAEGLIGPGSFKPDTAVARVYFFPGMGGAITENWLGKNKSFIKSFPGYANIKSQGDEFFYEIYPQFKPKVEMPSLQDMDAFPNLS